MLFLEEVTALGQDLLSRRVFIEKRKAAGDKRYARTCFWSKY